MLVAPTAVLVAGVLLALRLHFQPADVPRYVLARPRDGGEAGDARNAPATALAPGSRFELEAQPSVEVQGAVTARAFLVPLPPPRLRPADAGAEDRGTSGEWRERREWRAWRVPMEIGRDGSVHVAGPVDSLFAGVPPGEWEIVLAVGRPEMLPNDERELLRAAGGEEHGGEEDAGARAWRIVRERILLPERATP